MDSHVYKSFRFEKHPEHEIFIARLRKLIDQIPDLTEEKLSYDLGMSKNYINGVLNRRFIPSVFIVYKIADYFGLSVSELYSHEENSPSENILLYQFVTELPPNAKRAIAYFQTLSNYPSSDNE